MDMETWYKSFEDNFHICCIQSCYRLAHERQKNPDTQKALEECEQLYHRIEDHLGNEKILINRFDAAKNNVAFIESDCIYQQGFRDCCYLLRWIGLL